MKGLAFIQAVKKAAMGVIFSWPTEHSSVDRDLSEGTCFHSGSKEGCNGSYLLLAPRNTVVWTGT